MRTGSRVQVTDRLALDSNLSYGGTTAQSDAALPITFAGSTSPTTVLTQTITGGALGLNGYVEVRLGGVFSITADAIVSTTAYMDGIALTPIYNSATFAASAGPYYLDGLYWIQNQNSETVGVVARQMVWYENTAGTVANASRVESTKAGTDTSSDWTFSLVIAPNSAASGQGSISIARVTTYFIP